VDLNRIIAYSLRIGVLIGVFLAIAGLSISAIQGFNSSDALNNFSLVSIPSSAFAGNASGIAYLGILVLIATPILRVSLAVLYFGIERDRKYVIITLLVLAMLLFALFSKEIA
jgi:uncharacterized membrane protein